MPQMAHFEACRAGPFGEGVESCPKAHGPEPDPK
jgi:hypothetical protein